MLYGRNPPTLCISVKSHTLHIGHTLFQSELRTHAYLRHTLFKKSAEDDIFQFFYYKNYWAIISFVTSYWEYLWKIFEYQYFGSSFPEVSGSLVSLPCGLQPLALKSNRPGTFWPLTAMLFDLNIIVNLDEKIHWSWLGFYWIQQPQTLDSVAKELTQQQGHWKWPIDLQSVAFTSKNLPALFKS